MSRSRSARTTESISLNDILAAIRRSQERSDSGSRPAPLRNEGLPDDGGQQGNLTQPAQEEIELTVSRGDGVQRLEVTSPNCIHIRGAVGRSMFGRSFHVLTVDKHTIRVPLA